jgi:hypothetical protein
MWRTQPRAFVTSFQGNGLTESPLSADSSSANGNAFTL